MTHHDLRMARPNVRRSIAQPSSKPARLPIVSQESHGGRSAPGRAGPGALAGNAPVGPVDPSPAAIPRRGGEGRCAVRSLTYLTGAGARLTSAESESGQQSL